MTERPGPTQRLLLAGALAAAAVGLIRPAAARMGLGTNFVEVLAEGVPVGSRYVLESKLVDAKNNGDEGGAVRFDGDIPLHAYMRPGYEPIPDGAWLSFEPRTVDLGPGESKSVKLVLYVPDDPSLVGRRFQAMVWIHPVQASGNVALGLKSRFLFSVGPKTPAKPPAVVESPVKLASIKPYATGGRARELVVECDPVTVENFQPETMTYEYLPAPEAWKHLDRRGGERELDLAWIEVWPRTVVVPSLGRNQLAVRVRIPVDANPWGGMYLGPLRFVATRPGAKPVEIFNMVRVAVPALGSATGMASSGAPK